MPLYYIFSLLLCVLSQAVFAGDLVTLSDEQLVNMGIKVAEIRSVSETPTKKLPAKVTIPNKSQWVISVPQDGVIELMMVAEGDSVVAGESLVQINSPQIISSQNDYLKSLARLAQSQQEMRRDKSLFNEGIIAERRYLQSRSLYQQDQSEVAMQLKNLEMAGMDKKAINKLNSSRTLTSRLVITAPSDGVVMKQFATVGQRLSASDPLYTIAQLSPLWLEIHVPLELARELKVGNGLKVCGQDITGEVIAIGRQVHAIDQGILIRGQINQNSQLLTPGEFVEICFIQPVQQRLFEVPRSAVLRNEDASAVFVKTAQGFVYTPINIIKDNGENIVISGNLSPQQVVVIVGTAWLKAAWLGMGGE